MPASADQPPTRPDPSDALDITADGEHQYAATVTSADGTRTEHRISVPEPFLVEHGIAASQEPLLVRATLVQLLEEESAPTLPAEFRLDELARQLPGFPDEILGRL
jgi:hypothetical protein